MAYTLETPLALALALALALEFEFEFAVIDPLIVMAPSTFSDSIP